MQGTPDHWLFPGPSLPTPTQETETASLVGQEDIFLAATLLLAVGSASYDTPLFADENSEPQYEHASTLERESQDPDYHPTRRPSFAKPESKKRPAKRNNARKIQGDVHRVCGYCESTETPMWRNGPPGYGDLCNKVSVDELM